MALVFDPIAHTYVLDGVQVPSTTGVLRDQGLIQLSHIPEHILEKARVRGTAVHQLIHYQNEGDLDWASVDPRYRAYLDAWLRYREETGLRVLLCEYRIASRRHRLAGTFDLLAEIDGEGWLIDYATGNPDDVAKDYQTGSYLGMAYEWAEEDLRLATVLARHKHWRRRAIRLRPDGAFRVAEYSDPRDYARFQTLTAAWHIRTERGAAAIVDPVIHLDLAA
jgi:hypothetical protein